MCLAIPGKVIDITDDKATIEYGEERRSVNLLEDNITIGDYVLVQNKFIVQKIPKKDALESLKLWKEAFKDES